MKRTWRVVAVSILSLQISGCAHTSFTPGYPASWAPLKPYTNACESIAGCYSPEMPTQEVIPGKEQSPFGENSFARVVLKHQSDSIDTNLIKPTGSSSVCVVIPDEKTVVFELRSADTTSRAVFDQHNSMISCERDQLTVSRTLAHQTFMYSYYFNYRKSLVMANTTKGELVVRQDEDAMGIPYSGVRRVWSKYEKRD